MESIKDIVAYNCRRLLNKSVNLADLARKIGVDPTTVSKWKSGKHSPELDKIDRIANLIGVKPQEFFEVKSPQDTENTKDGSLEIIQQIASLGPSELEILMDTLKALSRPLPVKAQKKKEA